MEGSERSSLVTQLSTLLSRTSAAHGEYERDVLKGVRDEEWPKWYARYLRENGLPELLNQGAASEGLVADLDRLLAKADESHRANSPSEKWQDYYARYLAKRASGEDSKL